MYKTTCPGVSTLPMLCFNPPRSHIYQRRKYAARRLLASCSGTFDKLRDCRLGHPYQPRRVYTVSG
jgi:hypothetical protein